MTGSPTLAFTGLIAGYTYTVQLLNNGAAHTITWPGNVVWQGGSPPVLNVTSHSDLLGFYYDGTTMAGYILVENF